MLDALSVRLAQFIGDVPGLTVNNIAPRSRRAHRSSRLKSVHTLYLRGKGTLFTLSIALSVFATPALQAQTMNRVPGSIQNLSGQFPISGEFSFEQQIQVGTQGNPSNGNPFAYGHALQFRPWFHFDGIRNVTLTGSVGYIYYFTVPETSYYRHPEWRDTFMGTLKQPLHGGSLYEQIRGEVLNFRDSHGTVQHLPRVRFRLGQNLCLGEGGSKLSKAYLGLYQEAILQFPQPSYSHVTFTGARFFVGGGFELGSRTEVLLGFKAEGEVSSSGSTVTLFFGPAFSIEYNFLGRQRMHDNHQRTTAFKDF
jgi:hypothetical protein